MEDWAFSSPPGPVFGADFTLYDEPAYPTFNAPSQFRPEEAPNTSTDNWLWYSNRPPSAPRILTNRPSLSPTAASAPKTQSGRTYEPIKPASGIFDLFGNDDELDSAEFAVEEFLFSLPEPSEFGSMLPMSSQSSSENLYLSREVSIETRLSSITSLSSKSFRIPSNSKVILDGWLQANAVRPYLKDGDAEALAHLTGLTDAQVKNYIANNRLRRSVTSAALTQASSTPSLTSLNSSSSLGPRKGRKRYRSSISLSIDTSSESPLRDPNKIYQCTFCRQPFARKSDWKRHEAASHVPQEEWVCTPDFPTFMSDDGSICCVYCEEESPSEVHLQELHRYQTCVNKPESARTFNRKDKLQQHLSQVHSQPSIQNYARKNWNRSLNQNVKFQCGFCTTSEVFTSWSTRCEHVATHFENGTDITAWLASPGGILEG